MKQLSQVLGPMLKIAEEKDGQLNTLPTPQPFSIKSDGKLTIQRKLREVVLMAEEAHLMMSLLPQVGLRVEKWGPISIEGRTYDIESDFLYFPTGGFTDEEKRIVWEMTKKPSRESIAFHLARLFAHREKRRMNERQMEIVINDLIRDIIKMGCSEAAFVWAIEDLRDGHGDYGGGDWPIGQEIKQAIHKHEKRIEKLEKAALNKSEYPPKGFYKIGTIAYEVCDE